METSEILPNVKCPECEDGLLRTEERDTFPKQWVLCSCCELEVIAFFASKEILNAFSEAYKESNVH